MILEFRQGGSTRDDPAERRFRAERGFEDLKVSQTQDFADFTGSGILEIRGKADQHIRKDFSLPAASEEKRELITSIKRRRRR